MAAMFARPLLPLASEVGGVSLGYRPTAALTQTNAYN